MVAQWQHSNTKQWSNMLENKFFPLKNWVQFYKKKSKKNPLYLIHAQFCFIIFANKRIMFNEFVGLLT